MAQQAGRGCKGCQLTGEQLLGVLERGTYVKSPVASLTLTCSSVKKRVRVTMLVLMVSASLPLPFCNCADIVVEAQQRDAEDRTVELNKYQADCLRAEQNSSR